MQSPNEKAFTSDEERWRAIDARDRSADGIFYYGVKTTGVYCRPGCSSRTPQRLNVVYFTSCGEAEAAGFRPCKRCSPHEASSREHQRKIILRACQIMEESEESIALDDLSSAVGMSASQLHRLFKDSIGVTPKEYIDVLRMRRLKNELNRGAPVTQAIYEAGFNSSSRFYEKSAELLGMTATRYKKGAAGTTLQVAAVQSFLGWMLIAATDRGICSIEFGDDPKALIKALRGRFPKAELCEDDQCFEAWVSAAVAFVEAPVKRLDLPLDIQGTAFQRRVWKALQEIPPGTTQSYAEIAETIGNPRAARAVASACASNRLAVAIPCHRAVRTDGHSGGYRWGIERKKALLEREAVQQLDGG